jgi:NADH-quinone oxidoreductase subunit H
MTWELVPRALLVSLLLSGCQPIGEESPIRDVRPTTLEPGEAITVEANGARFTVGAPTVVTFNPHGNRGGLQTVGRAVAVDRVIVDELSVSPPLRGPYTVTVEQKIAGRSVRMESDSRDLFEMNVGPPTLARGAHLLSTRYRSVPVWLVWALVMLAAASAAAAPVPIIAGLVVVWERKIAGRMQSRIGPNRVGPNGWLQWLADGIKLLLKEDIVPREADPLLFRTAPYLAFLAMFLTLLVLPFSHLVLVADLDVGVLFFLSVTSLMVVSIIVGGWSSNSNWSLLGGLRAAAQIISYELPASISLLGIAALAGSLSTQKIVLSQGGWPWHWNVFHSPFALCACLIYFISALAEGNRTPFDLPEADSELVAGFNTEYSGFRFSLFPMVEWVNVFIIGAVLTTLFLGGWQVPGLASEALVRHPGLDFIAFGVFALKDLAVMFVIIWIRWTLPRFRVDQMMNLCWKYLLPASLICVVGVLGWMWLLSPAVQQTARFVLFLTGGLFGAWFSSRVLHNARRYRDLALNDVLGRVNS